MIFDGRITLMVCLVKSRRGYNYFLKQLKRAVVSSDDFLYFYTVVIRPVLEYACVVWHHNLTASQSR